MCSEANHGTRSHCYAHQRTLIRPNLTLTLWICFKRTTCRTLWGKCKLSKHAWHKLLCSTSMKQVLLFLFLLFTILDTAPPQARRRNFIHFNQNTSDGLLSCPVANKCCVIMIIVTITLSLSLSVSAISSVTKGSDCREPRYDKAVHTAACAETAPPGYGCCAHCLSHPVNTCDVTSFSTPLIASEGGTAEVGANWGEEGPCSKDWALTQHLDC